MYNIGSACVTKLNREPLMFNIYFFFAENVFSKKILLVWKAKTRFFKFVVSASESQQPFILNVFLEFSSINLADDKLLFK